MVHHLYQLYTNDNKDNFYYCIVIASLGGIPLDSLIAKQTHKFSFIKVNWIAKDSNLTNFIDPCWELCSDL